MLTTKAPAATAQPWQLTCLHHFRLNAVPQPGEESVTELL